MSTVEDAVAALRAGELVVIPTDTVYGLACRPDREEAVRALSALKGRSAEQPIALVAASVDALARAASPSCAGEPSLALLPGPYTLVAPEPGAPLPVAHRRAARHDRRARARRRRRRGRELLDAVGVVAATSANLHGGADPRRLEDVPEEILAGVAAVLDGGELPGTPSTVLDLTGAGAARPPRGRRARGGGARARRGRGRAQ